jgi:photosystem II stability/assembly factor-like uncharacterized protein
MQRIKILLLILITLVYVDHSYCQWNQITFPSNEDLYMVRFVSENTGWVVGGEYVYKTKDGGNNWQTQDPVMGGDCEALYAIDSLNVVYADYGNRGI